MVKSLGGIRACHENAAKLFDSGRNVLVYPGGDIDANRPYSKRHEIVFGQRRGYIRLALRHGIPIVPVVAAGAHSTYFVLTDGRKLAEWTGISRLMRLKVLPIAWSLPWGWTIGPPPPHLPLPTKIYVEFLDPVRFDRSGREAADDAAYVEACHERVFGPMQGALTRLADERRRARWNRVKELVGLG